MRRCTRPIQPKLSSTAQTPVASTTAEMRLVDRYESRNTKARELRFRALLTEDGSERLELARA